MFFEYYGPAGTGIKSRIDIYWYEPKRQGFSDTAFTLNPGFFFDDHIITEHYMAAGGGTATTYRIQKGQLNIIEEVWVSTLDLIPIQWAFTYSQAPFADTMRYLGRTRRLPEEYTYQPLLTN